MGTRQLNRLSARAIIAKQSPGLYCDGGGLYLQVTASGSRTWIFRFRSPLTNKLRDMGLGPLHSVGLPEAREMAALQRTALLRGLDPIAARDHAKRHAMLAAARSMTFRQCAAAYIESHRPAWRNEKHGDQWEYSLEAYCGPVFGALPVQEVTTDLVLQVLEPIWATKAETASRLRGRIENVLDWATVRGYRTGENPARWRGHLAQLLPALATRRRVVHFSAMPFRDVGAFMAKLREIQGTAARCLEFTILTSCRTNESVNATRLEFDLDNATWTIPGTRMKAGKEHRIPLSPKAAEIVRELIAAGTDFVFAGKREGKPLSNMAMLNLLDRMGVDVTVHGFRSSFRDWSAECSAFPHDVCEAALAHTISNAAEAAYRRGDLFNKRRKLMQAWADFLSSPLIGNSVLMLKQAA